MVEPSIVPSNQRRFLVMRALYPCFFVLFATIAFANDKLISIDQTAGMIIVQQKAGALKSYRIRQFTEITINGAKSAVGELRPGMLVSLGLSDAETVSKIAARGNPGVVKAPAAPEGEKRPAFVTTPSSAQLTRKIDIKLRVAGSDRVIIQNGKLQIEHGSWAKPTHISINDIKWEPEWKEKNSEVFTGFVPSLAPFAGSTVTVKQLKGRGTVKVLEAPTDTNGQKLVVSFGVTGSGAKSFEARISW